MKTLSVKKGDLVRVTSLSPLWCEEFSGPIEAGGEWLGDRIVEPGDQGLVLCNPFLSDYVLEEEDDPYCVVVMLDMSFVEIELDQLEVLCRT